MNALPSTLIRETFPVGPLQCNCTLIGDPLSKKAIVVDPGGDEQKILARLQHHGLTLVSIIHTHAHFDHFLASGKLKELTGATLHLHKADQPLWENLEMQCQMFGMPYTPVPSPDRWLSDDEELACGCGVALHTPGHTPGSMSFWFAEHKLLIAGDTLFRRGVGRTDLWGGDQRAIVRSIKERLYRLDEEAIVVTGHGPDTRLGDEMRENPFVRA
ncbi:MULTISPECIES: MBL fold metallo-hydrolase [Pseudomonas]|uniref:MBL fold metallo-hydrolase n=1 Tax=Pseudomonas mosselii TaxID=78327 RepID=A0A7W2JTA2_9PSED|nr:MULTISPECIES: MBL fold metallo-hydrolase [Pseudomonas]MBC7210946.1 MBL fold metallo-hydrolase [Pseudomonas sp.]KXG79187.1 MBL fold metallo-hydrolase [Pseudomonas mosselii]MBA6064756.1 MBL fold metallo-hydrolase [Pseudomonas mosselii]MBC3457057.1 MBL fold metallo-hydrolase [Pseudomonas mosselii]MBH3312191.1 MBL fold metallo-hydrolase [Pseudomonas mosselii]